MKFKKIVPLVCALGFVSLLDGNNQVNGNDQSLQKQNDPNFEYIKQSEMFQTVLRDIMIYYVDTVKPEKLVKPTIEYMLNKLDPYTNYYTDKETEDLDVMTTGKYGGVGAMISKRGSNVRVIESYEHSPADKAGLKPGDFLLSIDGANLDSLSIDKVTNSLRGKIGTTLDLVYKRLRTGDTIKVKVTRENIQIPAVPYFGFLKDSKIGYIAFDNFTQDCSSEVKNALVTMQNDGITALILDLRGNGGGLVDEAVRVVNMFLPKHKEVASIKGRIRAYDYVYKTSVKPIAPELPLVVLVNNGSASASEIVAGSLQDYDRAVLIGSNTYGKGLVQNIIPHPYEAKLKITTARYYIPSGRCIQLLDYNHRKEDGSAGIIPDSLRNPFKTSKGRTVYDGGGICPDIKIPDNFISPIAMSLFLRGYLEEFGIKYAISRDSLPNPDNSELPKSIVDDFEKYLEGKDYSYQTESQRRLMDLIESTKKELYYTSLSPLLDSLKTSLFHDKKKDFDLHKDEIYTLIENIVYTDYQYRKGRFRIMLRKDPGLLKAKEVLSSKSVYESYFNDNKVIK